MLSPVLREMFVPQSRTEPETEKLRAPKPAEPATTKPAESSHATAGTDLNALGQAVVAAFRGFNLAVDAASAIEGPQLVRLRLTPGPGVKVSSLANRAEDLQIPLKLAQPPLIKAGKGFVILDLPRPEPKPCFLKETLAGALTPALKSTVAFPIGIDVEGAPVVADFADPNTCHAGVEGSPIGQSFYLEPEQSLGRFSKAFFLPLMKEFIARRADTRGVNRRG
jgi:S-DNA-T family DNA segregation ATPase FtsK/SpoIIIE